ncbi:hypothetical protein C0991_008463 [Blastosporella zonata]|nr:hypothetical protein C0991_008463 [Blastosporella zonata]
MLKGDELKISEKPNDYKKFMDFLRTVQQNPSIVNSIREVKIIVSLDHDQSDKDIPWIFTCTPFHEFLLQLGAHNRVQYITISAMYEWTCFPKALSQALLGIFTNKSIQCVSLHYLSVPKDCFIHMARGGTPELHLSNMDILSSPHVATARGAQALMELHIEEMDSDSIGELIDALTPYIAPAPGRTNRYFPHLVDLTIGPTEAEQLPNYNQLVQASAFSLQILRWDYPASDFPGVRRNLVVALDGVQHLARTLLKIFTAMEPTTRMSVFPYSISS